jgi:hypothetical protein
MDGCTETLPIPAGILNFFLHKDYLHAVHLQDGIDPVWMAGGAFAAGSRG